ncbi:adenosine deaminase 2-like isoform X2 [Oratosquilla oratoria]|uniref:adenosine deaminase 2-like isoform X2 n=1 Tax=Oratosquilla oratoria TaxID=337810 RepID=UPI003F775513
MSERDLRMISLCLLLLMYSSVGCQDETLIVSPKDPVNENDTNTSSIPGTLQSSAEPNATYWSTRKQLLNDEENMMMGHDIVLTDNEKIVNKVLMEAKTKELDTAFHDLHFPPATNFMKVKGKIEASDVFQIIKAMPKGAALHMHDIGMTSLDFVISELTYWDDLYMCHTPQGQLLMRFFDIPNSECEWALVKDVRATYITPGEFDKELKRELTLITENPDESYPDINSVWSAFEGALVGLIGIVTYRPAWDLYFYQSLHEFAVDNVLYLEWRGTLPPVYEKNGTVYSPEESVGFYNATLHRFLEDYPEMFFGARFIYAPLRRVPPTTVRDYVATAASLRKTYPSLVAGFDLVGQEDLGLPLKDLINELLNIESHGVHIPVFFHAGETTWMGMDTDENLIDALLLNTTRIGHGYAINKHPKAKELARKRGVVLEVCPISNQVLKLVDDLRNHPIAPLIAEGFPIVVSSDDPATWGASGVSYDFYEAFLALGGKRADLRFLKQLAINSIRYSSLDEDLKEILMNKWRQTWNDFIDDFCRDLKLRNSNFTPYFVEQQPSSNSSNKNGSFV